MSGEKRKGEMEKYTLFCNMIIFSNSNHPAHRRCFTGNAFRVHISETNGSSMTAPYVVIYA